MLIDLHAHSSGISSCCRIPFNEVINQAKDIGIDGIILTNHYQKSYVKNGSLNEFVDKYIAEFSATKKYADKIGYKAFFGIELTMELYPNVHMLIYGVEPSFLKENPEIFDKTQKELYSLVKSYGGILIQAHPFRNGTTVLDTDYLDGVEINCHPLYGNSYSKELQEIAKKDNLIITCGGDYHADAYHPRCGMIFPDSIKSNSDILEYLLSSEKKKLYIQEPNCDISAIFEY